MTAGFSYDKVGPRAFPYLIAAGLLASGAAIVAQRFRAARSRTKPADDSAGRRHLGRPGRAGVPDGAARLDPGEHRRVRGRRLRFRQPRAVAQPVVRRVLAGVTFVLFNYGLGFRLPVGSVVEALL